MTGVDLWKERIKAGIFDSFTKESKLCFDMSNSTKHQWFVLNKFPTITRYKCKRCGQRINDDCSIDEIDDLDTMACNDAIVYRIIKE